MSFSYLGRACTATGEQDIWFLLNGTEVATAALAQTCDCSPGVVTLRITDPSLLALGVSGVNAFEVQATNGAEIAWVVASYQTRTAGGDLLLIDANGGSDAQNRTANLCVAGTQQGAGIAMGVSLSGGEQCDDGNTVNNDACSNNCTLN